MSLSDNDLTNLLRAQLSIQVAVTALLEGQRKIVEMIMKICKTEKRRIPGMKKCEVRVKRLKFPEHCYLKRN